MSNVTAGTVTVRVEGKDIGLSELLSRLSAQMGTAGSAARNYFSAIAVLDPVQKANQEATARYAQSLAQVALKMGDTAAAQQILSKALNQMTPNTVAANQVLAQLQGLLNQNSQAASQGGISLQTLAQGVIALRGAYAIASGAVQQFNEILSAGNELEKAETTFRVLSGSQAQYNANLEIAKAQQDKFGGSLTDTIEGLSEFANLSNRTGVEVNRLTNLARELAIVDPAQGFKGAGIALKEFDN